MRARRITWFLWLVLMWVAACAAPRATAPDADPPPHGGSSTESSTDGGGESGTDAEGSDAPDRPSHMGKPAPEALGAVEERVQVERYPRMVMPSEMAKGMSAQVFVGLATKESSATEVTVVIEGEKRKSGTIVLDLPKLEEGVKAWDIDVILSAPDFTIAGGDDFRTIQLPPDGPSTMARYQVTLDRVPASGESAVQAFLFHDGAFMGHIGRMVKASESLSTADPVVTETREGSAALRKGPPAHEVQVVALDPKRALVVISEPGKTMTHAVVDFDSGALQGFLMPKFGAIRSRGLDAMGDGGEDAVGMGMVRGLGGQLWQLTPAPLREYLLRAYADDDAQALRIYTNVPAFPWELVRPKKADGTELPPLASRFRLGRWHLKMGMTGAPVPPDRVLYDELVAMVPEYGGGEALPAAKRELAALQSVNGFRKVPGRSASVAEVVQNPPNGVLHFAGHGSSKDGDGMSTLYALQLEDGAFDSLAFLGLEGKRLRDRETLVFFNACELGKADAMATIVDGWAPAMLDSGASGYIGALWPVGDDEAAAFAEAFYEEVEKSIGATGAAQVTEILRCLRRRGESRQDPTWSAYVFYGDPATVLHRPGAGGGGRYVCQ